MPTTTSSPVSLSSLANGSHLRDRSPEKGMLSCSAAGTSDRRAPRRLAKAEHHLLSTWTASRHAKGTVAREMDLSAAAKTRSPDLPHIVRQQRPRIPSWRCPGNAGSRSLFCTVHGRSRGVRKSGTGAPSVRAGRCVEIVVLCELDPAFRMVVVGYRSMARSACHRRDRRVGHEPAGLGHTTTDRQRVTAMSLPRGPGGAQAQSWARPWGASRQLWNASCARPWGASRQLWNANWPSLA